MRTAAARSAQRVSDELGSVASRARLAEFAITAKHVAAQEAARRWQVMGSVVVLRNGPLTRKESWEVARLGCGPRALLTAFTAAEAFGLKGWERDEVHVLAPAGTAKPSTSSLRIRLHRCRDWSTVQAHSARALQDIEHALVRAAGTFTSPRPACGLLAAGVQQRLVTADRLRRAIEAAPRIRHRRVMLAAVDDIAQGAEALSEIDLGRLCRRFGLPMPERQTVRTDSTGRRRYLDALWRRPDGQLVVVEVDGALHLAARRWWSDQLRQNEIALSGALVLRFPSVVVRTEPLLVAEQLAKALGVDLHGQTRP